MNTNVNDIFEYASKKKFRYPYKGMISTEDLWDLSMEQLDMVYKALNKELNAVQGDSLMCMKDTSSLVHHVETEAKINIVKYIFRDKELEAEDRQQAAINAAKKKHIMDILAQKQDESLRNMSKEELESMLADLG